MAAHHYRITVDALDPDPGGEGLQSLSFFASTPDDIFAAIDPLAHGFLGFTASGLDVFAADACHVLGGYVARLIGLQDTITRAWKPADDDET